MAALPAKGRKRRVHERLFPFIEVPVQKSLKGVVTKAVMLQDQEEQVICRCPVCKTPFPWATILNAKRCRNCDFSVSVFKGIPMLVKDLEVVEHCLSEAEKGIHATWYVEPQAAQRQGPYRHHLQKRRRYVASVLECYARKRKERMVGLDLGCGDGANFYWLKPYLTSLYASDYNLLRLIRAARSPLVTQTFLADIGDYPSLDSRFDVIFFNHVLEHIPDDTGALSEVYRILKPGGMLILGVPNEGAFFWRLAYRLQPGTRARTDHIHFYTFEEISGKCRTVGFKLVEMSSLGWGVPHWSLDALARGYRWVDDLFEFVGRRVAPSQASSLYLILEK